MLVYFSRHLLYLAFMICMYLSGSTGDSVLGPWFVYVQGLQADQTSSPEPCVCMKAGGYSLGSDNIALDSGQQSHEDYSESNRNFCLEFNPSQSCRFALWHTGSQSQSHTDEAIRLSLSSPSQVQFHTHSHLGSLWSEFSLPTPNWLYIDPV